MSGSVGARFAALLAAKDTAGLRALLAPEVDFKGLTPGRFWEGTGTDEVLAVLFDHWFEGHDQIDALLEVTEGDPVEDTQHVGYRLAITTPDGPYVAAQQAYYRTAGDRIGHLRVMCSGFRPVAAGVSAGTE